MTARRRWRAALLALAVALSAAVHAEPTRYDVLSKQGQQALRGGDYDGARKAFAEGLAQARQANDKHWLAKFQFYHGNANLVQARKTDATGRAKDAAGDYTAVLKLRPESGSAMVNLAAALALLGDDEAAQGYYEKAIALDDAKQSLYRKQYAEFLQTRDADAAAKQLRLVLAKHPKSPQAQRQLVRTYRDPKYASRLTDYLDDLVADGEVLKAQEAALDALADPNWPGSEHEGLMRVLAKSLAAQHVDARSFADSETAARLHDIGRQHPGLKLCVDELMATIDPSQRAVDYAWWTASRPRRETLSGLLRSLARTHKQSDDPKRAEALYQRAVELDGGRNPKAVLDLVQFYSEVGALKKIDEVSRRYEYTLFQGKGQAYRNDDLPAIYSYHRTLAAIYANQAQKSGDWGSYDRSNTAAFQLEHAYRTARRARDITPDTQLVDQLAVSYAALGNPRKANDLRLDAARQYRQAGNLTASNKVLEAVRPAELNAGQRLRYTNLRSGQPVPAVSPGSPPVTPQGNMAVPNEVRNAAPNEVPNVAPNVAPSQAPSQAPQMAPNVQRPPDQVLQQQQNVLPPQKPLLRAQPQAPDDRND